MKHYLTRQRLVKYNFKNLINKSLYQIPTHVRFYIGCWYRRENPVFKSLEKFRFLWETEFSRAFCPQACKVTQINDVITQNYAVFNLCFSIGVS